MVSYNLDKFLSGHVFAFVMLLSRVGAVVMLFPGIGEHYVSPRTRMIFACALCFVLMEPLLPRIPALPPTPAELVHLISYEILIGLFFGTLIRLIMSVLEATGMIIGLQTGLSNATIINPALATQSPLPSAFLTTAATAVIFIAGIDYYLFHSIVALYDVFPPGGAFMPGDMAQTVIHATNQCFVLGVELAAPFIIVGLLFTTGLGILQRLLPSLQLFIISVPVQIWGGLLLFSLTIVTILTLWVNFFDSAVSGFFQR